MLVGAISMIPGGFFSTEAAIIFLLSLVNVSVDQAIVAAITIRVSTIWFAMLCGLLSTILLEMNNTSILDKEY